MTIDLSFTAPATDRIEQVAKRLGVEPGRKLAAPSLYIQTSKGDLYDVYELIHAVLDRIDALGGKT